ncbi:hypothetical protein [Snuella sedimenti]|uniref:DUF4595 domain-containing protein n=1 Tax=Snuella sedimenti TaxID=2798802 RepID=A0A8J7LYW7_9FLAO|nr:hypothetical protein [Snuella sedimenti]MBJ6369161.1 hypothetical protein [Snuella sedimenti]
MKKIKFLSYLLFILTLQTSCSDNNDDTTNNSEAISKTYLSKVTIKAGSDYYYSPNSTTSFTLNYDSSKKLTSINVQRSLDESGVMKTYNASYIVEYVNDQIKKVYADCATNDCEWNFISHTEGFHQISFEYGEEDNYKSVIAYEQIVNTEGTITYSTEIERYLLNTNNLVKQVEGTTEIIYSNNNIIGIKNTSSYNDGLKYHDYDDKKSVVVFTDDTHIMDINDYFPRLILDLKYSKNNFRKLDFPWRGQLQSIDFEYDGKNRPIKRTVLNKDVLNYTETFEYLE